MKIVFISNYFNHHQKSLSDALYNAFRNSFYFIQTEEMAIERKNMGWELKEYPQYVLNSYNPELTTYCQFLINEADVVIIGSAPEFLIKQRLKEKKLTFRYSERVYKKKCKWYELPARAVKYFFKHGCHKNLYMLCASAYTAADYAKTFTFLNKCYKWGYFTEIKHYENIDTLIEEKQKNSILWVARFIDWKHPQHPIEIAKRLRDEGYSIQLKLIGNGILEQELKHLIEKQNLEDSVHLLGSMSPEEVRIHMEQSEIFLFTSDRNEGWGAVLNEAMNSGCAVVANHAIGSVPFLINNNENGFIYKNGDLDDLYTKVKYLLDHPNIRKKMSQNAYETMITEWNADNAAKRFLNLSQAILNGEKKPDLYNSGVCSKSEVLKDNWY